MQSQDYPGAKWSVGQRVGNATDAQIDEAFAAGRILRTHVLRPTWHFVTPDDIRWMLELTAPRVHSLNAYMYRQLELDAPLLARSHGILERALRGGNHLTRAELGALLGRDGIVADKLRLAYVVMHAELDGLVCSGPLRGKHQTYALLDERAPHSRSLSRNDALAELVVRFLTGHGPATVKHFVWWSGLSLADANAGLGMLEGQLASETENGTRWFGIPATVRKPARATVYLVPEYDELLVGSRDLGAIDMPRSARTAAWTDTFLRPVIVGSKRAGTWRRTIKGEEVRLETNLFASLDPVQHLALEAAAKRYAKFLGMPVTLA